MADDKSKTGAQDRNRVAGGQQYEVDYFAKKHGIDHDQARNIIAHSGNSREKADAEAARLKRKPT